MVEDVTPDDVRARRFDVVRRGYDRSEVESFLLKVAEYLDGLHARIDTATDADVALGIDDAEARARELATLGAEIDTVMEAARAAAEGMRTRARMDVESWTSEADAQAYAVREAAWVEGTAMLTAAAEEADAIVSAARTDALRIRAEAEHDAMRHTSEAKRASEEALGAAENEAEGLISAARAESERLVRAAHQSAELAQERARALEERRAELLAELESTRSSLGVLEQEIESKRVALEEPEPIAAPAYTDRSHHDPDGGSVRIVAGSKAAPFEPVDPDRFVAEVVELHKSTRAVAGAESSPDVTATGAAEADGASVAPVVDDERAAVPDPTPASSEPSISESAPETDGGIGREPTPVPGAEADAIGSLFARLRGDAAPDPSSADDQAANDPESAVASEPPASRTAEHGTVGNGDTEVLDDAADEAETARQGASLIPVQNAALRSIKRLLVDLQNDALEHLRTDKRWVPDAAFTDRFGEPFEELAAAIDADGDDGGAAAAFAASLFDAVLQAVVAAREAGSGDRAIAAATSKVFRTWRSDEAERRVAAVASKLSERA